MRTQLSLVFLLEKESVVLLAWMIMLCLPLHYAPTRLFANTHTLTSRSILLRTYSFNSPEKKSRSLAPFLHPIVSYLSVGVHCVCGCSGAVIRLISTLKLFSFPRETFLFPMQYLMVAVKVEMFLSACHALWMQKDPQQEILILYRGGWARRFFLVLSDRPCTTVPFVGKNVPEYLMICLVRTFLFFLQNWCLSSKL